MSLLNDLKELARQQAIFNLLEGGVDAAFFEPMQEILKMAVITGRDFTDLVDELRIFILGDKSRLGVLDRHVRQVTIDTVSQFNAAYSNVISEGLGLEFYYYRGGLIRDSRAFCVDRNGKYFHKKEVEAWGAGRVTAGIENPTETSSNWQGKIATTTSENIFQLRGGWQCRHSIDGVSTFLVPKRVLQRNLDNGNWKPRPEDEDLI